MRKSRYTVEISDIEKCTYVWDNSLDRYYDVYEWEYCDKDDQYLRCQGMCSVLNKLDGFLSR